MYLVPAVFFVAVNLFTTAQAQVLQVGIRPRPSQSLQQIGAFRLTSLVRERLVNDLPVGMRLQTLHVAEGVTLPRGEIDLHVSLPANITQGQHDLQVVVRSRNIEKIITARVGLARTIAGKSTAILSRGSDVMVIVRSNNITVQSQGVAQEGGGIGERIGVLPAGASRVVKGMVVDAKTVEVGL